MNTNLAIIPTRSRPESVERCINALREHSVISDFLVAIDDDQADLYPRLDGVIYEVNPRMRLVKTSNLVSVKYQDDYKSIMFLGDDNLVRTPEWDRLLYEPIKARGYGISYGNDLFQGENLPTAAMVSTNIIKSLGFMGPPTLTHLYLDNFFKAFGQATKSLTYLEDVIIEHLHYMIGKAEVDQVYKDANSPEMYANDQQAFLEYVKNNLKKDVLKFLLEIENES